ncbi:MAG: Trk system potassium transporter TrkA [Muribaculaceae bacterium]|nr:Trk system potassium transporter TrkA [Muribaculaceae bacterium]
MRIVIAGAGEVGTHLAKMLSNEEQDIIVMDVDTKKLEPLENYNLLTHQGSAISFSDLNAIKTGYCDLFIAVTKSEARNILSCSMAKKLGAKKTVARIDNDEFFNTNWREHFTRLGIDHLIYPEMLAAKEIASALKRTWARNWFELFDGELIVVGVKIRSNASILNHMLKDLSHISNFLHVSAIKRNREIIIPRGEDRVLANDIVYIATTRDHIDEVREVCGKIQTPVDNVLIVGGNDIAEQLIKKLGKTVDIKIIEPDGERCEELAQRYPNCKLVQGDFRDSELSEEESVSNYDAFISLGENSAVNMMACMIAKTNGVPKTIAQVEDIQFINEAEALNIGSIVNKKLLASSRIYQILIDADEDNARCLAMSDAEVAEIIVEEGDRVTRADVKDLKLSRDFTIAGLVRNGQGMLVGGNTRIQAGDHVVVFCLQGAIHKLDKYFS